MLSASGSDQGLGWRERLARCARPTGPAQAPEARLTSRTPLLPRAAQSCGCSQGPEPRAGLQPGVGEGARDHVAGNPCGGHQAPRLPQAVALLGRDCSPQKAVRDLAPFRHRHDSHVNTEQVTEPCWASVSCAQWEQECEAGARLRAAFLNESAPSRLHPLSQPPSLAT